MTKACKATLKIDLGYTFATMVLQFVVANWMNEVKPPGIPISGIQVQFAAIGFCIASFFCWLGFDRYGLRWHSCRKHAAYPLAHFILVFVLFFVG